jgi:4-alpha-glucanotransferase
MKFVNAHSSKGIPDLSTRSSGILLHVTSLPGKYGIGDLGPLAHQWIDMLAAARQRWWQMLPLGPCGEGNSPYRSYSAFAGNPLLISPEQLVIDGLIKKSDLQGMILPAGKVDFAQVARNKMALLTLAYDQHQAKVSASLRKFIESQSTWLDDLALFMALRDAHPGKSWTEWPKPILRREPAALANARQTFAGEIHFHQFVQFVFVRQLQSLRDHAHRAGVALVGDLPIFVSPESADVWTHPELFQLDRHFRPTAVAGVPPDLFSPTGQRWGNPLYDWKVMEKDHFAWWKSRLRSALGQADLVRIDHFRGFESYWRIPAHARTAKQGRWEKAPGVALFEALLAADPKLPLLAEDLGIITPQVEDLRDRFALPGMRVLQFGFTGEPENPHAPHNFLRHCFAYTGTHDNDTTAGWYRSLSPAAKRRLHDYAPDPHWETEPAWSLIRMLISSTAAHTIVPLQDLLNLDGKSRMNKPGNSENNWDWRIDSLKICDKPLHQLARLCRLYDRVTDR